MGLSECTHQALEDEIISTVAGLHEWEDDEWYQFTQNCNRPPRIVDPKNAQALINQPAFKVPVKYLKLLKEASHIACFYEDVGRDLSQPNMRWNQFIKNFMIRRKAMKKSQRMTRQMFQNFKRVPL